jgi:hypothetical protein
MNAKKMLEKMLEKMFGKTLQIVVLVAMAALLTAGGVAADHGVAPVHAHRTTRVRYEQYLSALDETANAAPVPASQVTRVRHEQYREAIDAMERSFAPAAAPALDLRMSRLDSFGQYLAALELTAQEQQIPAPVTHSGARFEQYLTILGQMEGDFATALDNR